MYKLHFIVFFALVLLLLLFRCRRRNPWDETRKTL